MSGTCAIEYLAASGKPPFMQTPKGIPKSAGTWFLPSVRTMSILRL